MSLRLVRGAEKAFHFWRVDAFGERLSLHVYGAGDAGWFVATLRGRVDRDSGMQPLPPGEWTRLMHLVEHCDFWNLAEKGEDPQVVAVNDGEIWSFHAIEATRSHVVERRFELEPGLEPICTFCYRVCGFYRAEENGWRLIEP